MGICRDKNERKGTPLGTGSNSHLPPRLKAGVWLFYHMPQRKSGCWGTWAPGLRCAGGQAEGGWSSGVRGLRRLRAELSLHLDVAAGPLQVPAPPGAQVLTSRPSPFGNTVSAKQWGAGPAGGSAPTPPHPPQGPAGRSTHRQDAGAARGKGRDPSSYSQPAPREAQSAKHPGRHQAPRAAQGNVHQAREAGTPEGQQEELGPGCEPTCEGRGQRTEGVTARNLEVRGGQAGPQGPAHRPRFLVPRRAG